MKEITFLKAVVKECKNIKKYATEEEKKKLVFNTLDPFGYNGCVYGQMKGDCRSFEAQELINKCCVVTSHDVIGHDGFVESRFSKELKAERTNRHVFRYSGLEAYITSRGAKNAKILSFIKGRTDTLTIEDLKTKQLN